MKIHYHFRIIEEETGYSAQCVEMEGAVTQGDSWDHLQEMMKDCLRCMVECQLDSGLLPPLPVPMGGDNEHRVEEVSLSDDTSAELLAKYQQVISSLIDVPLLPL